MIVVYLNDEKHFDDKRRAKNRLMARNAGVRLVEVIPSEDIGGSLGGWKGVLDTTQQTARRLIDLGRKDAERILLRDGLMK